MLTKGIGLAAGIGSAYAGLGPAGATAVAQGAEMAAAEAGYRLRRRRSSNTSNPTYAQRRRLNYEYATPRRTPRRNSSRIRRPISYLYSQKYGDDVKTKDVFKRIYKEPKEFKSAQLYSGIATFKTQGEFFLHNKVGRERWFDAQFPTIMNFAEIDEMMNLSTARWVPTLASGEIVVDDPGQYLGGLPSPTLTNSGFYQRKFLIHSYNFNLTIKNQSPAAAYLTYWVVGLKQSTKDGSESNILGFPISNIIEDYNTTNLSEGVGLTPFPENPSDVGSHECDAIIGSLKLNGRLFQGRYKVLHKKTIRLNEGQEHEFKYIWSPNILKTMTSKQDWMKGLTQHLMFKVHGSIGDTKKGFLQGGTEPPVWEQPAPIGQITTGRAKLTCYWSKTVKTRQVMTTPSLSFKPLSALTISTESNPIASIFEKDAGNGDVDDMMDNNENA